MSLETRIGRMEAASQPVPQVRIEAKDKEDYLRQFLDFLLSSLKAPGPVDVELVMNGEVTRERVYVPPHAELVKQLIEKAQKK